MNDIINSVGKTGIPGYQWPVGIAYVAIPSDIEREVYVSECYLNNTISLWTEDGSFFKHVPCDIDLFNWIEFPLTYKEYGTALCYVTEPTHQQPIVIARLPKRDELGELREGEFKWSKMIDGRVVEISGSAKNNFLNLILNAKERKGVINIALQSNDSSGLFNISIDGNVAIEAVGEVEVAAQKRVMIRSAEESEEEEEEVSLEMAGGDCRIKGKVFLFNEGEQPAVLGKKLKSFLESFIDKISLIAVASPTGPLPLVDPISITALKSELEGLLSDEFFINK